MSEIKRFNRRELFKLSGSLLGLVALSACGINEQKAREINKQEFGTVVAKLKTDLPPSPTAQPSATPDATMQALPTRIAEQQATIDAQSNKLRSLDETANAPTRTPTPTATHTATLTPEPSPTSVPLGIEYKPFNTGDEVAKVRGGYETLWVKKVEEYDGNTNPEQARFVYNPDGTKEMTILTKNEWVYQGPMADLKPAYQIPQTATQAAKYVGGDVRPQDIRLVKITHVKDNPNYSAWMDRWTVPEGTVVGFEVIQNHGSTIAPYTASIPPGCVVEAYDDRQTERREDDIAMTIYNGTDKPIPFHFSGMTAWPWGDPEAIQIEQSNFTNAAESHFGKVNGKTIELSAASNIRNPLTTHKIVAIDANGIAKVIGINIPGQGTIPIATGTPTATATAIPTTKS